eukprot:1037390-Karenia_brevis.AAC.1
MTATKRHGTKQREFSDCKLLTHQENCIAADVGCRDDDRHSQPRQRNRAPMSTQRQHASGQTTHFCGRHPDFVVPGI